MKAFGVIMAGGGGTRFWPLSRQSNPKQLLNLTGKDSLINETIDRISNVIPEKDILVVTNNSQVGSMMEIVGDRLQESQILAEPAARNTTACIGYAAMKIIKNHGDGIMCIFPADHYIEDEKGFIEILHKAINEVEGKNELITLGINPTFPCTGYGYIRYDRDDLQIAKKVIEFKEKPEPMVAQEYYESGEYVWNSGMFVWRASYILECIKQYLPDVYDILTEIGAALETSEEQVAINRLYPTIPSISIDYGILEKSDNIKVIPASMGWNDVGSWDTLGAIQKADVSGNVRVGDSVTIDTEDCILYSGKRLIATIGVKNLIVVETDDSILVCDKDRAQDVKKIVEYLSENRQELL